MKSSKLHSSINFLISSCMVLLISMGPVSAAGIGGGVYAYPAGGQSQEQVGKDKYYCHNWAVIETGYDPTISQPPPRHYSSPPPGSSGYFGSGEAGEGGVVKDAAGGAALGAIGGAIAGNAGAGAAIGALAGGLFGGAKRSNRHSEEARWREQQRQQQFEQEQAYQRQVTQAGNGYRNAYSLCMSSRNYTVQ
ncbi:MAG: glycine zipper domain-containing protein [Gammaproteobacteria bacterium]